MLDSTVSRPAAGFTRPPPAPPEAPPFADEGWPPLRLPILDRVPMQHWSDAQIHDLCAHAMGELSQPFDVGADPVMLPGDLTVRDAVATTEQQMREAVVLVMGLDAYLSSDSTSSSILRAIAERLRHACFSNALVNRVLDDEQIHQRRQYVEECDFRDNC